MQRTWLHFYDLETANAKLFGYTYAALNVIQENIPLRDQVHFIATAEVTDMFGDTYDGVVVLTAAALIHRARRLVKQSGLRLVG